MKKATKKTYTKKEVSVPYEIPSTPPVEKEVKIIPFTGDFVREDMNSLRDKVNEIINFLNK